ncbi:MAG TPA: hypothetical protein PLH84_11650 [Candidatus Krumholzibacteria bacterium]|nr:hypothetical protein [Candidatus Krumholzibacteria bacterium]
MPAILPRFLRSPATLIASGLVLGGFLLAGLDWRFLLLAAAGAFGPGVLRELGWLRDKDELELQAARRAGYHAFLVGGLLTFTLAAFLRAGEGAAGTTAPREHLSSLADTVLAAMWFTWLVSSLLAYWGPRPTARRLLWAFGAVWLAFNLLAGEGDWRVSAMQALLALPFLLPAALASRLPRAAGVLALAGAVGCFLFFGLQDVFTEPRALNRSVVLVFFVGPLLAAGLALLGPHEE